MTFIFPFSIFKIVYPFLFSATALLQLVDVYKEVQSQQLTIVSMITNTNCLTTSSIPCNHNNAAEVSREMDQFFWGETEIRGKFLLSMWCFIISWRNENLNEEKVGMQILTNLSQVQIVFNIIWDLFVRASSLTAKHSVTLKRSVRSFLRIWIRMKKGKNALMLWSWRWTTTLTHHQVARNSLPTFYPIMCK